MRTTPEQRIADYTARGWWDDRTLVNLFDDARDAAPDHLALVDQFNRSEFTDGDAQRLSFRDVSTAAWRLAVALHEAGIGRDDIVVVQLPNIAELPVLYIALARIGAIISPVPVQYGRFELEKAREQLDPAAFITLTRFKDSNFAEQHGGLFAGGSKLFAFGNDLPDGFAPLSLTEGAAESAALTVHLDGIETSADDLLSICWTSGTTGEPKGVPRSHNMWKASGRGAHDVADMRDFEAILNPFPLINMAAIGGFLFPWLMRRATLVLHHPLDLPVFLGQIEKEKIAYTIAPPALLTMLLKQSKLLDTIDISSLRAIGSGSAPLSEWMVSEWQKKYGIAILNIFGSNEGICLASDQHDLPNPADRARYFPRFGVEGQEWRNRAAAQTQTRLVDLQTGDIVTEPGTDGELEIQGATVFDGYWKSPEANAEVFTEDGFFRTGDVFEIVDDDKGKPRFYKFVGRCKDIIIRGGVNISPDEIDNLLAGHPSIAQAAVVGYADDVMGERVGAVVVPKPGEELQLADVTDYLRDKGLAVFKLPEQLRVVDEIPHNAVGKVLRRELVALFDDATEDAVD